jgi:hypothetical protein
MKKLETLCCSLPFVEKLMNNFSSEKPIKVLDVERIPVDNSASILVALSSGQTDQTIGHFGLRVRYQENDVVKSEKMVMKVKPHGTGVVKMLSGLASMCGRKLSDVYSSAEEETGFKYTHVKEQEVYTKLLAPLIPIIYGVETDFSNDYYVILMEHLEDSLLLNSVMAPEAFTDEHIKVALSQIASWHAEHYNKSLPLDNTYWTDKPSLAMMTRLSGVWKSLLDNATINFPDLYTASRANLLASAIARIPQYWKELEQVPKTLIHNDFNPRNVCFKRNGHGLALCLYDWELCTYHIPQYDVVEFLCFVLDKDRYTLRPYYMEYYRKEMGKRIPYFGDADRFQYETELAALDFGLHRLGMYMMAHTISPYPFLPRVVESYFDVLANSTFLT